ncbi:hypothetical protein HYS93_04575 [Candidatus Daviesbacteria bacterium]|nr:hypothetical protein [Candidatus Daviesbacteria bacterium]
MALVEGYTVEQAILYSQCVRFGEFRLKAGGITTVYYDLRNLRSFPDLKAVCVQVLAAKAHGLKFDILADVPTGSTPLVSSLSDYLKVPQITPRLHQKDHGENHKIDGVYSPGQTALVIDDALTTGKSISEGVTVLRDNGLVVTDALVLLDRENNGISDLSSQFGIRCDFVTTTRRVLECCLADPNFDPKNLSFLEKHLEDLEKRANGR